MSHYQRLRWLTCCSPSPAAPFGLAAAACLNVVGHMEYVVEIVSTSTRTFHHL